MDNLERAKSGSSMGAITENLGTQALQGIKDHPPGKWLSIEPRICIYMYICKSSLYPRGTVQLLPCLCPLALATLPHHLRFQPYPYPASMAVNQNFKGHWKKHEKKQTNKFILRFLELCGIFCWALFWEFIDCFVYFYVYHIYYKQYIKEEIF